MAGRYYPQKDIDTFDKFNKELVTKIQRGIIDTWDSLDEIFPEGFLDNLTDEEVDEYDNFIREEFESNLDSLQLGLMLTDSVFERQMKN